ncbi:MULTISPECIES: hypothetical protein [unclassified Streptomyces]|uniref:hypothetical protein n=1 Tax=unclassified Streptomyces TaxID=2593676 RepID=UPI003D8BED16
MYSPEEDYDRTLALLGDLSAYATVPGADQGFIDVIGRALAVSLPARPPGYDPNAGPQYPGQE